MLIEKIFVDTLDIQDPENYSADPERYIYTYIRQRFEGVCKNGAYIIKIIDVLRRSKCRMKETDLSAEGYVDVEFKAEVSIFAQWDIITGVLIAKRSQIIVGKSDIEGSMMVSLYPSPEAETVRENQTISIRVLKTQYNPDQSQATAIGPLLTCDKAAPVYNIKGYLTIDDAKALLPMVQRIKSLLTERLEIQKHRESDIIFFEYLLYSYTLNKELEKSRTKIESKYADEWNGPKSYSLPDTLELLNIIDIIESVEDKIDVTGVWSRDLTIYRSSPLVVKSQRDSIPESWNQYDDATPRTAFALMLKTMYNFLKAINEMVYIYDSVEKIEEHKNIWIVMRKTQLPPPT